MKKLVKSAKQQFNERITNYCSYYEDDFGHQYYLCGEGNNNKSTIYRCHEDKNEYEYREYIIKDKFDNAINTSYIPFILNIVCNNPFFKLWHIDIERIYNSACHDANGFFEDIYEEIPDNVITAKQQFDEESKNAKEILPFLKVEQTSSNIIFYQNDNGDYYRFNYPSLEVMRKDKDFVFQMLKVMTNDFTKEDLATFMNWVDEGGEFPFQLSIINSMEYYQNSSCYIYQDINIENIVKLTPEQQKAVDMIHEGIKRFKDNGGDFVCYSYSDEWFAVNGCGVTYKSPNTQRDYDNLIKDGFIDVSEITEKQRVKIPLDTYWATDDCLCAKKL